MSFLLYAFCILPLLPAGLFLLSILVGCHTQPARRLVENANRRSRPR